MYFFLYYYRHFCRAVFRFPPEIFHFMSFPPSRTTSNRKHLSQNRFIARPCRLLKRCDIRALWGTKSLQQQNGLLATVLRRSSPHFILFKQFQSQLFARPTFESSPNNKCPPQCQPAFGKNPAEIHVTKV